MIAGLLKSTFIVQPSQIGYKSRLSTLSPTQTAPGKPVDRLPRGYFESDRNQKSHLETVVAPRLGIIQLEDWYSITVERARKAGAATLITRHKDSLNATLRHLYPEHEWQDWRFSKAPQRYWKSAPKSERKRLMEDCGKALGVARLTDWYSIQSADLERISGVRSMLVICYKGSLVRALEDLFVEHVWHPWKFNNVSRNWWKVVENRRKFIWFVSQELGITNSLDKWYTVSKDELIRRGGIRLLEGYHNKSISDAVQSAYPTHKWQPWRFVAEKVPRGFWTLESNRREYLEWLGNTLGFQNKEDWVRLRRSDLIETGGSGLLEEYFDGSILSVLQFLFPGHLWEAWKFDSGAPRHYWAEKSNRRAFMDYMGEKFGIRDYSGWVSVSVGDVISAGGGPLLALYNNSLSTALASIYPSHNWDFEALKAAPSRKPALVSEILKLEQPANAWYFFTKDDFPAIFSIVSKLGENQFLDALSAAYPQHSWNPQLLNWRRESNLDAILKFLADILFQMPSIDIDAWHSVDTQILDARLGPIASRRVSRELPRLLWQALPNFSPWKMRIASADIWADPGIRKSFIVFVGLHLQIGPDRLDSWYSVPKKLISELGGRGLLRLFYNNSLLNALKEVYPTHEWYPWPFNSRGSAAYWSKKENIDHFFQILAIKIGVRQMSDWYQLTQSHFRSMRARRLLAMHDNSPSAILRFQFPHHVWHPWKFSKKPHAKGGRSSGEVESLAHSVASELQLQRLDDWYRVSLAQLKEIGVWYSIESAGGLAKVLSRGYPEHKWDLKRLSVAAKKAHQLKLVRVVKDVFPFLSVREDYKLSSGGATMELDVFVPELGIAFEYQGEYHYRDILFAGETGNRAEKDATKASTCARAGITLIQVPYWWDGTATQIIDWVRQSRPELTIE